MEREVRVEGSPSRCPYCRDDLADLTKVVACAKCGARHHDACHAEHGACASCGERAVLSAHAPPARGALEPPRGSKATIARRGDAIEVQFPVPAATDVRLAGEDSPHRTRAIGLAGVAAATLGLGVIAALAGSAIACAAPVLLLFGVLLLFAAGLALLDVRSIERPPARVVLGSSEIEFPIAAQATRKAARADLGRVRTERVPIGESSHEYRLTVDVGIDRVRVWTGRLTEPEIDWLADVMRSWKG